MSRITLADRYLPNTPPRSASPAMRQFLRDELDLLALSVNNSQDTVDAIRSTPRQFLVGVSDDVTMDTTPDKFVNYSQGGALGNVPIEPDKVTGNIILPIDGAYNLTAFIYGLQASVAQNEAIRLLIDVNGVKQVVASVDVATAQTQDRTLSAVFSRGFNSGDVISMFIDATGPLGILEMIQTNLEMLFLTVIPPGGGPFNIDWYP